jgi:monoamine oxidase
VLPKVSFADKITLNRLTKNLDKATRDIDVERPWLSPLANELDKQRFSQYLRNNLLTKRHFGLIKPVFEAHFLNGIDQISALHGVLEWQEQDKQKFQILGGSYQLPRKLAQEVDILSRQKVKQIKIEGSFARVVTQHHTFRCRHVLVALPPAQSAEIRYNPTISTSKASMWDAIKPGRIIKSTLIFDEPFWRGKSWSGKAYVGSESPFQFLIDAGTSQEERGIISTYTIGNNCIHLEKLTQAETKEIIFNHVIKILQCVPERQPAYFQIYDWRCPPNGYGAYHIFQPGLLTNFENHLIKRENIIYWASAEYDPIHRGTMEGAIRSGFRAAREILSG